VDEVDQDGEVDAAAAGLGPERLDLGVVPVDEGGPGPAAVGVAAVGLVERLPGLLS
jgi:hypothetical protein